MKVLKVKELEQNCYDKALDRIRYLFDNFDHVVVAFSGGKDSTVCLNLAAQVAKEKGRLPLNVYTADEEAIHPETVKYIERVSKRKDINFKWFCMPLKLRNACSRLQPFWHTWHPDDKKIWVRPLPKTAITKLDNFVEGMSIPDMAILTFQELKGSIAEIRGLRADESMRRRAMVSSKVRDNYIATVRTKLTVDDKTVKAKKHLHFNFTQTSPIYDFRDHDVWLSVNKGGWDYNKTYDEYHMAGMKFRAMRVCPPFGEEPLNGLWQYSVLWPELWEKMINRVHGADTAGKFAKSELYLKQPKKPPKGMNYKQWAQKLIKMYPPGIREQISESVRKCITMHTKKTKRPIPEEVADFHSGLSWKFICIDVIRRGDTKGRKAGMLTIKALNESNKMGLTLAEVKEMG